MPVSDRSNCFIESFHSNFVKGFQKNLETGRWLPAPFDDGDRLRSSLRCFCGRASKWRGEGSAQQDGSNKKQQHEKRYHHGLKHENHHQRDRIFHQLVSSCTQTSILDGRLIRSLVSFIQRRNSCTAFSEGDISSFSLRVGSASFNASLRRVSDTVASWYANPENAQKSIH